MNNKLFVGLLIVLVVLVVVFSYLLPPPPSGGDDPGNYEDISDLKRLAVNVTADQLYTSDSELLDRAVTFKGEVVGLSSQSVMIVSLDSQNILVEVPPGLLKKQTTIREHDDVTVYGIFRGFTTGQNIPTVKPAKVEIS